MYAGEHLVRFVDEAQIERRRMAQALEAAIAAGIFATNHEHARRSHIHIGVGSVEGIDAEQLASLRPAPAISRFPWTICRTGASIETSGCPTLLDTAVATALKHTSTECPLQPT